VSWPSQAELAELYDMVVLTETHGVNSGNLSPHGALVFMSEGEDNVVGLACGSIYTRGHSRAARVHLSGSWIELSRYLIRRQEQPGDEVLLVGGLNREGCPATYLIVLPLLRTKANQCVFAQAAMENLDLLRGIPPWSSQESTICWKLAARLICWLSLMGR
jgi:hypothetical protein